MKIVRNVTDAEIKGFKCCAVDTEWTKNYKIKNGNKPFLFSLLFYNDINIKDVLKEQMDFKFVSVYIDEESEIPELINLLNHYLDCKKLKLLVGHQVISDLYTFVHFSKDLKGVATNNLAQWIGLFKDRANNGRIFDTRFDLKNWLVGKSRRLVDVCYEMKIRNQMDLHKQPELNKSMTALQNEFMQTKDSDIRERLSVMNIRHNLSSVLVYVLYINKVKLKKFVNINKMLYRNLNKHFKYVNTQYFKDLMAL